MFLCVKAGHLYCGFTYSTKMLGARWSSLGSMARCVACKSGGFLAFTTQSTPIPHDVVPENVAFAVYAMGASVLLSVGFAVHEWLVSSSRLDPMLRFVLFAGDLACLWALLRKHLWVRYALAALTVLFYVLLAVDADGLTANDFWHMLAKAPIDLFVITRIYSKATSQWIQAG